MQEIPEANRAENTLPRFIRTIAAAYPLSPPSTT